MFVAAAADRDIDVLVRRTAHAALAVRDALLELEDQPPGRFRPSA